jgi:uncharacterized repeat protein (TIGR02543 family)
MAVATGPSPLSLSSAHVMQRATRPRALFAVLLVTVVVAAIALTPSRLIVPSSARPLTHQPTQQIPAALATAIHSRLGPGPVHLGTAPLVSGIAATRHGWTVKSASTAISAQINKAGATAVSLHGSSSATLEAVGLSSGSMKLTLSVTASTLNHGQLSQQLGTVQSLQQVTSAGLEQRFTITQAPVSGAKSVTLDLHSAQSWRVIRHGAAIQVQGSKLIYGGLHTTDARGQTLPSHFVVTIAGPQIVVDTRGAAYPITIDPTWASQATPEATLISSGGTDNADFGYSVALSADDTTALVAAYGHNPTGGQPTTDSGAVYVYHVTSPGGWSTTSAPTATLTSKGLSGDDGFLDFGYSVALSADGTTALIGSPSDFSTGGNAAYIYQVASESKWVSTSTPTAILYDGSGIADGFGEAVALSADGETAVIGAPDGPGVVYPYPGDAYVYHVTSETGWTSTATPTATLTNDYPYSGDLGDSVALSANGSVALVGSEQGSSFIYEVTSASDWVDSSTPTATLSDGEGNSEFGYSLALSSDGTTALIGSPAAGLTTGYGAAYVFQVASASNWLTNSAPAPVSTLTDGDTSDDRFGSDVAFSADGTTALIGAENVNSDIGAVYVFHVSSEVAWSSTATPSSSATLTVNSGAINDMFGSSLALSPDGTTALITSIGTGYFSDQGETSIDQVASEGDWSNSSSTKADLNVAGNPNNNDIGYSVALSADGTTALVGYASLYEATSGTGADTVYVFHASSEGTWSSSQTSVAVLSNNNTGDTSTDGSQYGTALALSADGTTAFVGDIFANSGDGAVYVYQVASEDDWTSKAPLVATLSVANAPGGSFGWGISLSSDGTTALIGNGLFGSQTDSCELTVVGAAYIFHVSSETAWANSSTPTATLTDGGAAGDCFGATDSLSADGTTALIGAYAQNSDAGAAYIFHVSSESDWETSATPTAMLSDPDAGWFSWSLALSADGTTALIGAPDSTDGFTGSAGDFDGSADVFHVAGEGDWVSTTTPLATLDDPADVYYTVFGWSLALSESGTTALISGDGSGVGGGDAGAVFAYNVSSESAWTSNSTPTTTLTNALGYEGFGWAIALSADGTTALIGDEDALIYGNIAPTNSTPDGSGTLSVSPSEVVAKSSNSLTFTYTATGGPLNNGTIEFANPPGWSLSYPVATTCGYPTSGGVSLALSTDVEITGVTLAAGASCTITYGTDKDAQAPSSATTSTFSASEASTSSGTLTNLATSPVVNVKASAQTVMMAATTYTTVSQSGTYNVDATSNDTDPGATITYGVSSSDLDTAGCAVNAAGDVTFTGAGVCTINATGNSSTSFAASAQVQQLINVYVVLPTDTITFDSDGGTAVSPISGPRGSTITLPPAPTLVGSTFDGWSTESPDEGYYTILTSPYTLTGSVTLYAEWTLINYEITFDSEGGSSVPGYGANYGDTFTLPAGPTFTGFTFDGWFAAPSGGTALTSPYTITANATLYAQWTPNSGYSLISFNAQGGSAVDSVGGANGSTIPLPAAPTYANHTFNGWFANPTGGTALTSPYTLSSSVTLYAQWTAVVVTDAYSYNTAGGSAAPAGGSGPDGSTITLAAAPTKAGFTFGGWNDGTATYGAGASYTLNSNGAAIIFTAQWTAVKSPPIATNTFLLDWPPVISYGFERGESFIVTVAGVKGVRPTGTITIESGSTVLCTTSNFSPWFNGTYIASCNLTSFQLPVGSYAVTAVYSGDAHYAGSTSATRELFVVKDWTSVSVSVSPWQTNYGNESAATFSATVRTGGGEAVPNGETVTIHVGSEWCIAVLHNGTGTCSIANSALPPGQYLVTASYGGDATLSGASSGWWNWFFVKKASSHVARSLSRRGSTASARPEVGYRSTD